MDEIKRAAALLCIRASSRLMDFALRLTPAPTPRVLRDDMDTDMERSMRDAELLGRALRGIVG